MYLRHLHRTIFTACRKPDVVAICWTVPELTSLKEYSDTAFPSCLPCTTNKLHGQLIPERGWFLSVYSHSSAGEEMPGLVGTRRFIASVHKSPPADHSPRQLKQISILISHFTKLYFSIMFLIRLTLESVIFYIDITHWCWYIFTSGACSVSSPSHHQLFNDNGAK